MPATVTLFVCGDVMLGRGVDQILPNPGDPSLHETFMSDARDYVALAERANGTIPRPVDAAWPWGDALPLLAAAAPDVRLVNLETSVTTAEGFARRKAVHYRMHPDNLASLVAARPDTCVLANNHVLDFGPQGLLETLDALAGAGITTVGAGRDAAEAHRPAAVPVANGARVLVSAWGMADSGIPATWAATTTRPGVAYLDGPSEGSADEVLDHVDRHRLPGDLVVVSVHWGANWSDHVRRQETRFAHALVDGGVDLVHGHSSHHPRPVEVYGGRLVLYGCGDLVDDYEGIGGYEAYRPDLRLLYLATLDRATGHLQALRMVPLQARRFRLEHAAHDDAEWLRGMLERTSRTFGTRVDHGLDGTLVLQRPAG